MATVLIASDLAALRQELRDTLEGPELTIEEATSGPAVLERVRSGGIDVVVADLQMGAMGAMAICLELRHEESYGACDPVGVVMLLDRRADVFLARRSTADGFLVKPLDPLKLRRAVRAVIEGDTFEDDAWRPTTVRVGTPGE